MDFQGEAIITITDENGNKTIHKGNNTINANLLKDIYRVMVAGEKFPFTNCPGGIGLNLYNNGTHSNTTAGFNHSISGFSSMWLSSFASTPWDINVSGTGSASSTMSYAITSDSSNNQELVTYTVDQIPGSQLFGGTGSSQITGIHLLGSKQHFPFSSDADTRVNFLGDITGLSIGFSNTDSIKIQYIIKTPAHRGDSAIETLVSGWSQQYLKGMLNTIVRGAVHATTLLTGGTNPETTRESTNVLRICGAYLMETTSAQSNFATTDTTELANAGTAFTKAIPDTMKEFSSTTPTKTQASNHASAMYAIANAEAPSSNAEMGTGSAVAYAPDADFLIGTISESPDTQTSSSPYEVTIPITWSSVSNTKAPNAVNIYARKYDCGNNRFIPTNNTAGGIDIVYRILPDSSSFTGWATGDNVTANLKFKVSALSS